MLIRATKSTISYSFPKLLQLNTSLSLLNTPGFLFPSPSMEVYSKCSYYSVTDEPSVQSILSNVFYKFWYYNYVCMLGYYMKQNILPIL